MTTTDGRSADDAGRAPATADAETGTTHDAEAGDGTGADGPGRRVPVGEALPGVTLHPLAPGEEAVFVYALVRTRDAAGATGWSYRTSAAPNREELLGALRVQAALVERELLHEWEE